MKRTWLIALALVVTVGMATAAPRGMQGREGNRGPGMLFKFVAAVRADLGLSADQNQKLDALLNDVRNFYRQEMQQVRSKGEMLGEEFVSDAFNATAIQTERKKAMEERRQRVEAFMSSRIQQLHDLLTKEQRQKLLDLMKEKRQERMQRMRDRRPMGRRGAGF